MVLREIPGTDLISERGFCNVCGCHENLHWGTALVIETPGSNDRAIAGFTYLACNCCSTGLYSKPCYQAPEPVVVQPRPYGWPQGWAHSRLFA